LDASATSVASAVGPMIGASMAAGVGLRLPFLLTAGIFGLAACLTWALVPADTKEQAG
jgi:predicted MFS family arabinose efflux permease